jgi:hypothetical protein
MAWVENNKAPKELTGVIRNSSGAVVATRSICMYPSVAAYARDAIAEWARMSYGFMGRTPDYKASFMATLGASPEFYAPFEASADAWYRRYGEQALFLNDVLINPPIDRVELSRGHLLASDGEHLGRGVGADRLVAERHADSRGLFSDIPLPVVKRGPDGSFGYMPIYSRLASDYLAAALPLGLEVRRCDEVRQQRPIVGDDGTDLDDGTPPPAHVPGDPPNIWALHPFSPAATNAAWLGKPRAIIWHFQLAAATSSP